MDHLRASVGFVVSPVRPDVDVQGRLNIAVDISWFGSVRLTVDPTSASVSYRSG